MCPPIARQPCTTVDHSPHERYLVGRVLAARNRYRRGLSFSSIRSLASVTVPTPADLNRGSREVDVYLQLACVEANGEDGRARSRRLRQERASASVSTQANRGVIGLCRWTIARWPHSALGDAKSVKSHDLEPVPVVGHRITDPGGSTEQRE